MNVDVLLGSDIQPWQQAVLELVRTKHEVRLHHVLTPSRRSRSPVVALYARIDRWVAPSREVPDSTAALDELLASAQVVLDLTEATVSDGRETAATVLVPRPTRLDEEAMLELLVARRTTLGLEITTGDGGPVAASTIALARLSARRSSSLAAHRLGALVERALEGTPGGERNEVRSERAAKASFFGTAPLLARAAVAAVRVAVTRPTWRVALGTAAGDDPFSLSTSWRPVEAPPGHFYADPFLARSGSKTYLFVENFDVQLGLAGIAVVDLESGEGRTVLSAAHHLSYPFVFEVDGVWYMVPESADAFELVLYRCDAFPYAWSRDSVLLDSTAVYDATLLERDGLWWLFYAAGTRGAADDDELHVWFSEELRGPYRPHPLNPVRSTAVGSRPAGRVVERDGRLLRPAQDGSREYGGAIVIQLIDRLSTAEYSERTVGRIDAAVVNARGIHTIERLDELVVVDTKHVVAKRRLR